MRVGLFLEVDLRAVDIFHAAVLDGDDMRVKNRAAIQLLHLGDDVVGATGMLGLQNVGAAQVQNARYFLNRHDPKVRDVSAVAQNAVAQGPDPARAARKKAARKKAARKKAADRG